MERRDAEAQSYFFERAKHTESGTYLRALCLLSKLFLRVSAFDFFANQFCFTIRNCFGFIVRCFGIKQTLRRKALFIEIQKLF